MRDDNMLYMTDEIEMIENTVQNAILNLTKNKTTLVIAHRLSTIHNADKIFVLKNGKIIKQQHISSFSKIFQLEAFHFVYM